MARIDGTNNADTRDGTGSADEITGFGGDDQLAGGGGDDYVYGGTSDGSATEAYGGRDYLDGGAGDDRLHGGGEADVLYGGDDDDKLYGDAGNDTLTGGAGKDVFVFAAHATSEVDTVTDFSVNSDKIDLSAFGIGSFETVQSLLSGSTSFPGATGAVLRLVNGYQAQTILLNDVAWDALTASNFVLSTSKAASTIAATAQGDLAFGGAGDDKISGLGGDDRLFGEANDDTLYGGGAGAAGSNDGNDGLYGGSGDDRLHGGTQNDFLDGGTGDDKLYGDSGNDVLHGGAGKDVFVVGPIAGNGSVEIQDFDIAADRLDLSKLGISDLDMLHDISAGFGATAVAVRYGGAELDLQLDGVAKTGLTAKDVIFYTGKSALTSAGTAYADDLFGSTKADALSGGDGDDAIWGGGGNDKLYGGTNGSFDTETGGGSDVLKGGAGADKLYGGGGADVLAGGTGDDRLDGGLGADTLTGGSGKDVFLFVSANQSVGANSDLINDFTRGEDKIDLSKIDARAGGSDDAFVWDGKATAAGQGHLAYTYDHGFTHVFADVDGKQGTEIDIYLVGHIPLTASDFVL